ncbi:MAG: NADH-quinone oxidoreductase subunit C [Candidatus Diapherotrites archaeon]|nr:NADH-quinone oxidoreductase subunit C [Candidatus Diapherotrites archaeon]
MNTESFVNELKNLLSNETKDIVVSETQHGKSKAKAFRLWATIDPKNIHGVVRKISLLQKDPHFSVSSGTDLGNEIELLYHFALNYAKPKSQVLLTLRVKLPKSSPVIDTITDIIPGAEISEKEKREFFGIEFRGLPPGNAFLDESLAGVHPWRKDEKGASKFAKNIHNGEKNG